MNIQEELRISGYAPVVGYKGTEIGDLFEAAIEKVRDPSHEFCFLMSMAYNFGLVSGKREERAKKKKREIRELQLEPELAKIVEICMGLTSESLEFLKKIAIRL